MKPSTVILIAVIIGIIWVIMNFSGQDPNLVGNPKEIDHLPPPSEVFVLVDSRPKFNYERGTGSEAININDDNWDYSFPKLLGNWVHGTQIFVFDDQDHKARAVKIAKRLMANNITDVYVYTGGVEGFRKLVVPNATDEFRQF